jgi:transcriptional regulator with XRE-family HTH domain
MLPGCTYTAGTTVSASESPLVQRRRLRVALRRAREAVALTQESVADAMEWSPSKIIRIEAGSVAVQPNDLIALLGLYKIEDPQRVADLKALAKESRKKALYSRYRKTISPALFQFIEYETGASAIRTYEILVVPGLLQTREYATSISRLYRSNPKPEEAQSRVELRMKRQQLLADKPDPPSMFFVLDEAVIRRSLDDEATSKGQIANLITMAKEPNVTIEIVPFSVGLHGGMGENFTMLEFSDDDKILYFETAREFLVGKEDEEEIAIYSELFERLRSASLGPEGSLDYLVEAAKTLS